MTTQDSPAAKTAWVLTFYAFKGGTGRTLALSNVARYLAEARGYRIGLVDLDLESPGLPHQPLTSEWERPEGTPETVGERIDTSRGFIELFLSLTVRGAAAHPLTPAELADAVVPLRSARRGNGALFLMPAAAGSASCSAVFHEALRGFEARLAELQTWNPTAFEEECAVWTSEILQRFVQHYSLDYVFIDGRTGVGPFHSVYASRVPHALVLFCSLNEQNVQGSLAVLQDTAGAEGGESPVFLVASPVPTAGPRYLEERLASIDQKLRDMRTERLARRGAYSYELPATTGFLLPYTDLAAYQETYFVRDFPHAGLTREYMRLARGIESLVVKEQVTRVVSEGEFLYRLEDVGQVLRIAAENIALEPLCDFIERTLRLERLADPDPGHPQCTRLRFGAPGRPRAQVELELWPSTERDAPWELAGRRSRSALDASPDLLMVPQSSLADVAAALEVPALDAPAPGQEAAFDFDFLDQWYPGWRRWCADHTGTRALPFSLNTTILCANDRHLRDLCATYWRERGERAPGGGCTFFPSNWHVLLDLVHGAARTEGRFVPFAFARHERALYYEWLNVVLSFGGADTEAGGDGGLAPDRNRPVLTRRGTVDGTRFFLHMVRATRAAEPGPLSPPFAPQRRMDELVMEMWDERLSIFTGWTDSFRFDGDCTRAARTDLREDPPGRANVRLGRMPRDIRYRRRPLVANWVAVVNGTPARDAALAFMRRFLDPATQVDLLWSGFPCGSKPLVERALQDYGAVAAGATGSMTERNRAVFLAALLDALEDGYPVPSFPRSTEWIDWATRELEGLVARVDEGMPVDEEDVRRSLEAMSGALESFRGPEGARLAARHLASARA